MIDQQCLKWVSAHSSRTYLYHTEIKMETLATLRPVFNLKTYSENGTVTLNMDIGCVSEEELNTWVTNIKSCSQAAERVVCR